MTRRLAGPGLPLLLAAACAPFPAPPPPPIRLPPLPVDQVVVETPPPGDPRLAEPLPDESPRITFTASNAPLREVLPLIAEAAGVTLVLDPEVTGRVSFHFEDTPALEALRMLAREAGFALTEAGVGPRIPFRPRTVFFVPPVNVNTLDARGIQARFGVSRELAEWVVASRVQPW
jgi:hypothetical protein